MYAIREYEMLTGRTVTNFRKEDGVFLVEIDGETFGYVEHIGLFMLNVYTTQLAGDFYVHH
jgi:hypothetical protein